MYFPLKTTGRAALQTGSLPTCPQKLVSMCMCVCGGGQCPFYTGDATGKQHLVFLQAVFLHHLVSLLLKGDDDQGHEDIDEEEGEHDKVDDVEDGHLHAVPGAGTLVLEGGVHGVLENPCGRWGGGEETGEWDKGTGMERNSKRKWTRKIITVF